VTCREFTEFMAEYLSGTLPPATRETFESHLTICENCQRYLTIYDETTRLGRQAFDSPDGPLPADVPEALVSAILAARRKAPGT
jgi:anti-sigma factor RsiW